MSASLQESRGGDVMNLYPHIEEKTYIWTDDCPSYNKLIAALGSDSKVVSTHRDYDRVNHLNNVNSFVTIERLKQEKLFSPPELRWEAGQTA
jgi:transposase-like protein